MSEGYFLTIDSHLGLTLFVSVMMKSIGPIFIDQTTKSGKNKDLNMRLMYNQDICEESNAPLNTKDKA